MHLRGEICHSLACTFLCTYGKRSGLRMVKRRRAVWGYFNAKAAIEITTRPSHNLREQLHSKREGLLMEFSLRGASEVCHTSHYFRLNCSVTWKCTLWLYFYATKYDYIYKMSHILSFNCWTHNDTTLKDTISCNTFTSSFLNGCDNFKFELIS